MLAFSRTFAQPNILFIIPRASFQKSSKVNSSLNSAGLSPGEFRVLGDRQMTVCEEPIITAIKKDTFNIYAPNAVFHDPVGIASGVNSIRAQFLGLAKIFPRADIPKFRLLQNPPNLTPNTILIDQDVAYSLDDDIKVTTRNEEWNHEKTTTEEDGFLGFFNEGKKKFTAIGSEGN